MNGKRYTGNGTPILNLHGIREGRLPERGEDKNDVKQRVKWYSLHTLRARYLCKGEKSVCWACECSNVCEYGKMYMQRLHEQEENAGREWVDYDTAARNVRPPKQKFQQW